jgi:autotransporter-associated beta strand protein
VETQPPSYTGIISNVYGFYSNPSDTDGTSITNSPPFAPGTDPGGTPDPYGLYLYVNNYDNSYNICTWMAATTTNGVTYAGGSWLPGYGTAKEGSTANGVYYAGGSWLPYSYWKQSYVGWTRKGPVTFNKTGNFWYMGMNPGETWANATSYSTGETVQEYGPEYMVAQTLHAAYPTNVFNIVKYAAGGTSLNVNWDPAASNSYYDGMKRWVQAALRQKPGAQIAGFFWLQGESDAIDTSTNNASGNYFSNLTNLIAHVRADFGVANLPVIIAKISPGNYDSWQNSAEFPNFTNQGSWTNSNYGIYFTGSTNGIAAVRSAQDAAAATDPLHIRTVDTADLPLETYEWFTAHTFNRSLTKSPAVAGVHYNVVTNQYYAPMHFDGPGIQTIGTRMGQAWLALQNVQPKTWAAGTGVWDINTTSNWWDTNLHYTVYRETSGLGDLVTFDDTATGTGACAVTVPAMVSPLSVTISNNSRAYSIGGAAGVGGTASLTKAGAGLATLSGANGYSGGTFVSGGTLQLGSSSALGLGQVTLATATLDLNGYYLANNVLGNGAGGVIRNASTNGPVTLGGVLTVAGNSYTYVDVEAGATTVISNAMAGSLPGGGYWLLDKSGPGLCVLTATNATTYDCKIKVDGGTLRASYSPVTATGPGVTGNNYLELRGGVFEPLNNLTGSLGYWGGSIACLDGSSGFSAYGAAVTISLTNSPTLVWGANFLGQVCFNPSPLVLNDATANTNLTLANSIDLAGADRAITVGAQTAIITGSIVNSGATTAGFIFSGPGTLVLSNASTYNGATVVTNGVLEVAMAGGLATGNVTVQTGGTLKLDAPGAIGSGATVSLASAAAANLAYSGTATIAGLTVNGQRQVAGTWGSPSSGAAHTSALLSGPGMLNVLTGPTVTSLSVTSSANPSVVGVAVTFTATINGVAPTGSVSFMDGATLLGTGTISAGQATLTSTALTLGAHVITVLYGGDYNNLPSVSPALNQQVNANLARTTILPPYLDGTQTNLVLQAMTVLGVSYVLESSPGLEGTPVWTPVSTNPGTGGLITNLVPVDPGQPKLFFRYLQR